LEGQGPGPSLEQYAIPDPNNATYDKIPKFGYPVPKQLAFSFAGLKTRIQRETAKMFPNLKLRIPHDLARAMARRFQEAAVGHVVQKVEMALDMLENDPSLSLPIRTVVASGGVASNMYLRAKCASNTTIQPLQTH
jgi:tRNA A37 threonylcarbamoyltransferase TsaD